MALRRLNFKDQRILLIENNHMMRRLVRDMLAGFGVELRNIIEADRVPDALQHIYAKSFDLVITDFFLGDLDGGDFTRHIRGDAACINRKIPILLITGAPNSDKVLKALESGVNEMLAKPIAPSALYYRIYSMLTRPRPFVITAGYTGPSRSRQRLEGLAKLAKNRRRAEPQQWRSVIAREVRYPSAEPTSRPADMFLLS